MFKRGSARARDAEFSFIGPEVTVTGDIAAAGRLHIDGTVTGDVRCASLVQSASGSIHGNIVAGDARLAGRVEGAVEAEALSLEAEARITGDIVYETLAVAPGAQVEGRFRRRKAGEAGASAPAGAEPRSRPARTASARPRPAPPELFAGAEAAE